MKLRINVGLRLLNCCVLLCLAACTAAGSPISYIFTATTRGTLGSPARLERFELITPDFLPVETNGGVLSFGLADPEVVSCTACAEPPLPTIHFLRGDTSDLVQFADADGILRPYFFAPGVLSALGTFDTLPGINVNAGTLVVAETPEPSAVGLALGGMLVLLGMRFRPGTR